MHTRCVSVKGEERRSAAVKGECNLSRRRDAAKRMLLWFKDDLDHTSCSSDLSIFPSLQLVTTSLKGVVAVLCLTTQQVKKFSITTTAQRRQCAAV
jgi:hypothetical protein